MCKDCQSELEQLSFTRMRRSRRTRDYFIRKEVEILVSLNEAKKRKKRRKREEEERRRREEEELNRLKEAAVGRKREVENVMQMQLEEMDPILAVFVLGDYLTMKPTTSGAYVHD